MPLTIEDILGDVRSSHESLFKHLRGVNDEQVSWKPYPESKSIHETLAHLIAVEWSAQAMLNSGDFPDYESDQKEAAKLADGKPVADLVSILKEEQNKTLSVVETKFKDKPLDEEINFWGYPTKLGVAIARLGSEDTYHSGQIAYIRLATDPGWDYYKEIYSSD